MSDLSIQSESADFVTLMLGDQLFGIPVLEVRDVLGAQRITRMPLAPRAIAGSLNLRGRIVTVIDVRARLGLPPRPDAMSSYNIVILHKDEFYSLLVDKVGEVMSLSPAGCEPNPPTLDPRWGEVSNGIYRLKGRLLVALDISCLLHLKD